MFDHFNRLAKILRIQPEALLDLENKMTEITGKKDVIQKIAEENDLSVSKTLSEFGLSKDNSASEIREALQARIIELDKKLPQDPEELIPISLKLVKENDPSTGFARSGQTGFFIKKEKAVELLEKYPPQNLLDFFEYKNVRELVDKESFESVFAALRFTQTTEWMHKFFDEAYNGLTPNDFEERSIQLKVLEKKWLDVAENFLEKKYHNVSHLKEFGIIFIIPLKLDAPGEILRVFTLLLHYLNEVPFYSKLFKRFSKEENFIYKLKSLLRGDALGIPNFKIQMTNKFQNPNSKVNWLIIQRYLAKDDPDDPRLFMPHVNPEAEHWFKAEESLSKLGPDYGLWKELDFVGDFFPSTDSGQVELVSLDLIDMVMTLVKKGEIKYLYHQQEALWNKIFIEYFGRDKMDELIENNIIKGYIDL